MPDTEVPESASRSGVVASRRGARLLWWLLLTAAVGLAPPVMRFGVPAWRLPPEYATQVLAAMIAFLVGGLGQQVLGLRGRSMRPLILVVGVHALAFFAAFVLLVWSGTQVSRGGFAIALILAVSGAALDTWLGRFDWRVNAALAMALVLLTVVGAIRGLSSTRAVETTALATEYHRLTIARHLLLPAPAQGIQGGALAIADDLALVATTGGDLHVLRWDSSGALQSSALSLSIPVNWRQFQAEQPESSLGVRVTGLAARIISGGVRLLAVYDHWNGAEQCFTTRVARIDLARSADAIIVSGGNWQVLFESRPCLKVTTGYDHTQSGGRLILLPNEKMLLSLGDRGLNGLNGVQHAQDPSTDYGKVLILNQDGTGAHAFSIGHRNPQGLAVDGAGRIWETEHGPQGGDEINVLVRGGNYGWPLVSYGTDYGHFVWPFSPNAKHHGQFSEPAHVFVPAIGISSLIVISSSQFPHWAGDLLVASLRAKTLYRIRHREDRVAYAEPIPIGHRIRDLAQAPDGRLILWTDEGYLIEIGISSTPALYDRCSACHEPIGGASAFGPPLRGIVGATVATHFQYNYSQSLRRLGGSWTETRLDDFLRDPATFAPGTTMTMPGIADAAERAAIIEFLKRY